MSSKARRFFGVALIVAVSGFWIWVARKNAREDFFYLYAGTSLYSQGENPYDKAVY